MATKGKRKKCGLGYNPKPFIGTGFEQMMNPENVLYDLDINKAKALHENQESLLFKGLDGLGMLAGIAGSTDFSKIKQSMALGGIAGNVPIEGETGEIVETPNNETLKLSGPTHEQGGIDLDVPEGSKVYSKRVKKLGESMAKRKEDRVKKLKRIESLLEKSPKDKLLLNTLEKIKQNNEKLDQEDLELQEAFSNMFGGESQGLSHEDRETLALGSPGVGIEDENYSYFTMPEIPEGLIPGMLNSNLQQQDVQPFLTESNLGQPSMNLSSQPKSVSLPEQQPPTKSFREKAQGVSDTIGNVQNKIGEVGVTPGDMFNIAGVYQAGTAPLRTTLQNRASDLPHKNLMQDFGKESLNMLENAVGKLSSQRDRALKDVQLLRDSHSKNLRSGARGINTKRALDLVTEQELSRKQNQIEMGFAEQMMNLMLGQANTSMQIDQQKAMGQQIANAANRADQDAFHTALSRNRSNLGLSMQHMGSLLNSVYGRKEGQRMLKEMEEGGLKTNQIMEVINALIQAQQMGMDVGFDPTALTGRSENMPDKGNIKKQ